MSEGGIRPVNRALIFELSDAIYNTIHSFAEAHQDMLVLEVDAAIIDFIRRMGANRPPHAVEQAVNEAVAKAQKSVGPIAEAATEAAKNESPPKRKKNAASDPRDAYLGVA